MKLGLSQRISSNNEVSEEIVKEGTEANFIDLGFNNKEPSLKKIVFARHDLKELTGNRGCRESSGRDRGIT